MGAFTRVSRCAGLCAGAFSLVARFTLVGGHGGLVVVGWVFRWVGICGCGELLTFRWNWC